MAELLRAAAAAARSARGVRDVAAAATSAGDVRDVAPAAVDRLVPEPGHRSAVRNGLDTAAYVLRARSWRLLPFHTLPPVRAFESRVLRRGLGTRGSASLALACSARRVPYEAAVAASLLKSAASIRGPKGERLDEFAFSCLVDCRRRLEPALAEKELGNYTLSLLMSAKVRDNVGFWDLARHLAASMQKDLDKGKQFTKMPLLNLLFSQVLKYPSMTPNASCRTILFTLPLENRHLPDADDCIGRMPDAIGPLASLHHIGPCFSVSSSRRRGELVLSFVYPSPLYSHAQMAQILSSSVDLLHHRSTEPL